MSTTLEFLAGLAMKNASMISKTMGTTFIFLFIFTSHIFYYFSDYIDDEAFTAVDPDTGDKVTEFNPC